MKQIKIYFNFIALINIQDYCTLDSLSAQGSTDLFSNVKCFISKGKKILKQIYDFTGNGGEEMD